MDGRRVGPYELTGLLGRGAMGEVHRARHAALGVERAVKLLTRVDEQRLERFAREGRALARVAHPSVVRVHEAGRDGGAAYLVMDLVEGEPLTARLARGRPPLDQALGLAAALARGVAALHAAGVVHRDLKPDNVLVRPDGAPVIVDLGVALAPEHDERLTRTGVLVGTPQYMAPEQLLGREVGAAADVHALGLIAFELVTGQAAVPPAESLAELIGGVTGRDRPRAGALDPDLPAALDTLLARLVARAPERRPTATEAARAFEAISVAAGPSSRAERRRRRALVAAPLAAAALLVAGLAAGPTRAPVLDASGPPPAAGSVAPPPGEAAPRSPVEGTRQLRRVERLEDPVARLEALGEWLARWPDHPERPTAVELERALRRQRPRRLDAPPGTIAAAFVDDRRVATGSADGVLLWDAGTGRPLGPASTLPATWLLGQPGGGGLVVISGRRAWRLDAEGAPHDELDLLAEPASVALGAGGRVLLAGGYDGVARAFELPGGRHLATLAGHAHTVWSVAVSPDGRWAATGTGAGFDEFVEPDTAIRLWSLAGGGALVHREPIEARVSALAFAATGQELLAGTAAMRLVRLALDPPGVAGEMCGGGTLLEDQAMGALMRAPAHSGVVRAIAVGADGRSFSASGGEDPTRNELRAWDAADRERYHVLGRPSAFRRLALSPDGRRLVSLSDGGVVEVWDTGD
ncbi:MAG: serine/threonine-protein kinase [Planctomycetes bacterium]|nr:serine/threonine-protein kinase [Planctomycetota bacterium]